MTAPTAVISISTNALSRSIRYSMPKGGAHPPMWYEIGPVLRTCHSRPPAIRGSTRLVTNVTAKAIRPLRQKPARTAAISGTTT